MSLLLSCQSVGKTYGANPLFQNLSFGLFEGDRIGLVGPNGSGKSTLLKIIAGLEAPDSGTRAARKLLRLGDVPQDPSFRADRSIEETISAALDEEGLDADEQHARVNATLAKVGFADTQQPVGTLSGGWTRRLAIACAIVRSPDLLLMDEPTNHLDIEGILWLERLLRTEALAYLVVSHDRYFLENVTNRLIELNPIYPEGFFDTRGTYSDFLERKDQALRGQVKYQETLANRVRREVEWLKRGPKARTRKSGARLQEAARLQEELVTVGSRNATRTVRLELQASDRKTRRMIVAEQIEKSVGSRLLIKGLSLTLSPGMRLGILGPNGSGKTTLLRMLTGEIPPDKGSIERAPDLRVVYLDQHREQINPAITLRRALATHGDQVVYQDRPIHVTSWAKRFLFAPEQLDQPVGKLSGGERARVSIAQLMLQPADLLILDEPTNDLDIPTLEVLEESLLEFSGAMALVTHDRFLFECVSTHVLALDGSGRAESFADYRQWENSQRVPAQPVEKAAASRAAARSAANDLKRLSHTERREWERMEATILAAEQTLAASRAAAHDPSIASDAALLGERYAEMQAAQQRVEQLYARWAELEAKQAQSWNP